MRKCKKLKRRNKNQNHTWAVREGFFEEFTDWPRPKKSRSYTCEGGLAIGQDGLQNGRWQIMLWTTTTNCSLLRTLMRQDIAEDERNPVWALYVTCGMGSERVERTGEVNQILNAFLISIEESKLHSKRTWGPSGKGGIWHCLSTPAFQGWLSINFLRNVSRTLGKYFINVSFLTRHWNLLVDKYSPVFLFIRVYN